MCDRTIIKNLYIKESLIVIKEYEWAIRGWNQNICISKVSGAIRIPLDVVLVKIYRSKLRACKS